MKEGRIDVAVNTMPCHALPSQNRRIEGKSTAEGEREGDRSEL
jgi:hypothetical protein